MCVFAHRFYWIYSTQSVLINFIYFTIQCYLFENTTRRRDATTRRDAGKFKVNCLIWFKNQIFTVIFSCVWRIQIQHIHIICVIQLSENRCSCGACLSCQNNMKSFQGMPRRLPRARSNKNRKFSQTWFNWNLSGINWFLFLMIPSPSTYIHYYIWAQENFLV